MTAFPAIRALEPSIKPAEAEQTYDKAWMSNLHIESPSPQAKMRATLTLVNYNKATGELSPLPHDRTRLAIGDLEAEVNQYPLIAQTMSNLLTVVDLLGQRHALNRKLTQSRRDLGEARAMPEGADKDAAVADAQARIDAANAGLATVTESLGVTTA